MHWFKIGSTRYIKSNTKISYMVILYYLVIINIVFSIIFKLCNIAMHWFKIESTRYIKSNAKIYYKVILYYLVIINIIFSNI